MNVMNWASTLWTRRRCIVLAIPPAEQVLERHARLATPSIRADGRRRVLEGSTSLDEVLRVTRED